MYNILVYDYINKCHLIYDTKPVEENELYKNVDVILNEIKESMPNEEIHVSYFNEIECDVYIYKENVSKGWIWNSIDPEKQFLFKLQTVVYLKTKELKEFKKFTDTSIQTENDFEDKCDIEKKDFICQTNFANKIKPVNDIYILDDIPLELNSNNSNNLSNSTTSFSSNLSNESNLSNDSNTSVITTIASEICTDLCAITNDVSRYSIEWGRNFQQELKDRLNLENYGLYKYKKE